MDLFKEVIPSITQTKENLLELNPGLDKKYPAFMVNRVFGLSIETLFYACVMNMYPNCSNQAHYDYYFYSLPKKKIWSKWHKPEPLPHGFEEVKKFFGYNNKQTHEVYRMLTKDQIEEIVAHMREVEEIE